MPRGEFKIQNYFTSLPDTSFEVAMAILNSKNLTPHAPRIPFAASPRGMTFYNKSSPSFTSLPDTSSEVAMAILYSKNLTPHAPRIPFAASPRGMTFYNRFSHEGLTLLIINSLRWRDNLFICFSRSIAATILGNSSK